MRTLTNKLKGVARAGLVSLALAVPVYGGETDSNTNQDSRAKQEQTQEDYSFNRFLEVIGEDRASKMTVEERADYKTNWDKNTIEARTLMVKVYSEKIPGNNISDLFEAKSKEPERYNSAIKSYKGALEKALGKEPVKEKEKWFPGKSVLDFVFSPLKKLNEALKVDLTMGNLTLNLNNPDLMYQQHSALFPWMSEQDFTRLNEPKRYPEYAPERGIIFSRVYMDSYIESFGKEGIPKAAEKEFEELSKMFYKSDGLRKVVKPLGAKFYLDYINQNEGVFAVVPEKERKQTAAEKKLIEDVSKEMTRETLQLFKHMIEYDY